MRGSVQQKAQRWLTEAAALDTHAPQAAAVNADAQTGDVALCIGAGICQLPNERLPPLPLLVCFCPVHHATFSAPETCLNTQFLCLSCLKGRREGAAKRQPLFDSQSADAAVHPHMAKPDGSHGRSHGWGGDTCRFGVPPHNAPAAVVTCHFPSALCWPSSGDCPPPPCAEGTHIQRTKVGQRQTPVFLASPGWQGGTRVKVNDAAAGRAANFKLGVADLGHGRRS